MIPVLLAAAVPVTLLFLFSLFFLFKNRSAAFQSARELFDRLRKKLFFARLTPAEHRFCPLCRYRTGKRRDVSGRHAPAADPVRGSAGPENTENGQAVSNPKHSRIRRKHFQAGLFSRRYHFNEFLQRSVHRQRGPCPNPEGRGRLFHSGQRLPQPDACQRLQYPRRGGSH